MSHMQLSLQRRNQRMILKLRIQFEDGSGILFVMKTRAYLNLSRRYRERSLCLALESHRS